MKELLFLAAVTALTADLGAAPVYSIGSRRYFGDPANRTSGFVNQPLSAATNDELVINYSDGNVYDGRSAIAGSTLVMETATSVAISQSITTDNISGSMARDRVVLFDSVLVTGGAGTAYLSPVVHVSGTFVDNSSVLFGAVHTCFGTGGCIAGSVPGGFSTGGIQNVDLLWAPSPLVYLPGYEFTFGVPVTPFMFFGTAVDALGGEGVNVPAGESLSADFQFQLLGYKVFDSNGNELSGANVYSDALSLNLPEPGSFLLLALGLASIGVGARLRRGSGAA